MTVKTLKYNVLIKHFLMTSCSLKPILCSSYLLEKKKEGEYQSDLRVAIPSSGQSERLKVFQWEWVEHLRGAR